MPISNCIPDHVLPVFLEGELSDEESASCEEHLLNCTQCLERTRSLANSRTVADARSRDQLGLLPDWDEPLSPKMAAFVERLNDRSYLEAIGAQSLAATSADAPTVRPETEAVTATSSPAETSVASSDLAAGSVLGPYRILSKLGAGGMGAVYKATHIKLDKVVAVKVLSPQVTKQMDAVVRFEREMRAVGKLNHPHIVQAHDAGEINGVHYLTMEYVEGADLAQIVKSRGPFSIVNACKAIRQSAQALVAAHGVGLVHRDIKPSNLLIGKNGQVKLLDLGLALLADDTPASAELTTAGQAFGTPDYMAPEQWEDAHAADARTDLYALGCTLFYLLVGRAPYGTERHRTAVGKMKGHVTEAIPNLQAARPDVPAEVAAIYEKLLAKAAMDRFQTAAELVEALAPFVTSKPQPASVVVEVMPETVVQPTNVFQSLAIPAATDLPPKAALRTAGRGKGWTPRQLAIAAGGAATALLLGVIIITITNKDGTRTKVELPSDAQQIEVAKDGKSLVKVTSEGMSPTTTGGQSRPADAARPSLNANGRPRSSPSIDLPAPPQLDEWLKGRTVLTVAQDGSGQFQTIQAALEALKPGQVVQVLDKGPYRENLCLHVVPGDCGLISEQQTEVTFTEFNKPWGSAGTGHFFGFIEGLRIHGFHFIIPANPSGGSGFVFHNPSGLVLEDCHVQVVGPDSQETHAFLCIWLQHETVQAAWIRDCRVRGRFSLSAYQMGRGMAVVERNFLDGPGNQCLWSTGDFRSLIIRHNILGGNVNHADLGFENLKLTESMEVSNNTSLSLRPFVFAGDLPAKNVTIRNNLRTDAGMIAIVNEQGAAPFRDTWQVSHNAYLREPQHGDFGYIKQLFFPRAPHDVLAEANFMATDMIDPDYLRIPLDSPQATGGTGGDWPSYIGALKPGPAPQDGDWFTRLRERWLKPAVSAPATPSVSIVEPPPLDEWLKDRTVLTVAQDGSGQFKTIQAALEALLPGQVVKVLDAGPYRERITASALPKNTGLISAARTVIEVTEWPNGSHPHVLGPVADFRLHGFRFRVRPINEWFEILSVNRANGLVIENCAFGLFDQGEQKPISSGVSLATNPNERAQPLRVRECVFEGVPITLGFKALVNATIIIERNFFSRSGVYVGTDAELQTMIVRHNVFDMPDRVYLAFDGLHNVRESLSVLNNTVTPAGTDIMIGIAFMYAAPKEKVTIRNNLSNNNVGVNAATVKNREAAIANWTMGHNGYVRMWGPDSTPRLPSDVVAPYSFLSLDPTSPNAWRIRTDSEQATAGAGGDLPGYLGALPPGQPPAEGDWFTHLRARWPLEK